MNGRNDSFRWIWIGLSGMLILIGIAAVLGVLLYGSIGVFRYFNSTTPPGYLSPWNWIWNLIGLFIFLWFLFFIVRIFLRPWRGHRYHDFWFHDGAEEILRERYARGEITKDQFDKMMDDIRRNRG